jgi:hypothetical protein
MANAVSIYTPDKSRTAQCATLPLLLTGDGRKVWLAATGVVQKQVCTIAVFQCAWSARNVERAGKKMLGTRSRITETLRKYPRGSLSSDLFLVEEDCKSSARFCGDIPPLLRTWRPEKIVQAVWKLGERRLWREVGGRIFKLLAHFVHGGGRGRTSSGRALLLSSRCPLPYGRGSFAKDNRDRKSAGGAGWTNYQLRLATAC